MNIAINTRLLLKDKLEGIGWFTYETLNRITRSHPEHNFLFIFDRPWDEGFVFSENVTAVSTKIPCRHPFLWYLWFNKIVPRIIKKHNIDIFVSPDGYNIPNIVKSYVVIHDLNFVHFPKNVPYFERKYYEYFMPKFINNACRIGTVSEFSKKDICSIYKVNSDKVDVLCNGASSVFQPISEAEKQKIKQKISGGLDYFLFVGALNPRKNIGRLLKAFDKFCDTDNKQVRLVIAGEPMFSNKCYKSVFDEMKHKDRVLFIGRQSRKDLGEITAGALALVFPSTFEGFGIPIVEAMNCDVPVITSNITSMPEVAGDAALLTNPYSEESISTAMIKISKEEGLRNELISKGRIQREKYSWDKAAELFWNGIEKCF